MTNNTSRQAALNWLCENLSRWPRASELDEPVQACTDCGWFFVRLANGEVLFANGIERGISAWDFLSYYRYRRAMRTAGIIVGLLLGALLWRAML